MMKRAKKNYLQLWKVMNEQFFCQYVALLYFVLLYTGYAFLKQVFIQPHTL